MSAQDALALAAKNRPALQAAKLHIEQAQKSAKATGAMLPTTIGLGASTRSEVGANDMDLFVNQPLDIFGRIQANRGAGKAEVQLARAEYFASATTLQNETLTEFSSAVAAKHLTEVSEELLKISEGLLQATKRRFDEGKVAEIQVVRAGIEYERSKQYAELKKSDLNSSLTRLSGLLAVPVTDIIVESDAQIQPLNNPAYESRPDILTLKAQAEIAESEAGIAKVSNRPEFNLQVVRSPWSTQPGYFVGRAQFTWAIFDHGKARNTLDAAKKRSEASNKLLDDAVLKAKAELRAAQIEVDSRRSRISSYEAILASARELVAKSQKGYLEGFGTQIDVLEATRALREVELELVEARQQLSLAVIGQYRASGFLSEVLK